MSNKYFVWKDPSCNGENIEWIEMDNVQFSAFIVLPENKFRRFIRLGNQICHEADVIVLETTEAEYLRWDKERRRGRYLRENSTDIISISLDAPVSGNEQLTLADAIPNEEDLEEKIIHEMMLEHLAVAFASLDSDEQELLTTLYGENISIRSLASQRGIHYSTLTYQVRKIIEKMKKFFVQF